MSDDEWLTDLTTLNDTIARLAGERDEALRAVEYFDAQSKRRRAERDAALARIAAVEALLDDREAAFRGGTRTAAIPSWIGHVREALAKAPE